MNSLNAGDELKMRLTKSDIKFKFTGFPQDDGTEGTVSPVGVPSKIKGWVAFLARGEDRTLGKYGNENNFHFIAVL